MRPLGAQLEISGNRTEQHLHGQLLFHTLNCFHLERGIKVPSGTLLGHKHLPPESKQDRLCVHKKGTQSRLPRYRAGHTATR
jgi:hypothetical protein